MNSILIAWTKPPAIILLLAVFFNASNLCQAEHPTSMKGAHFVDVEKGLVMSVNDFNVAHQAASSESVFEIPILPFQKEKVLRSRIFDYAITFLLTITLTWFVRPTYLTSLSPTWYPSIPIAYRRLII
jgi:hypothetical protein